MKLVISIVHDEDSIDLIEALTEKEFRVTKLATTGGFLKAGNTTLLVGVEEKQVEKVTDIIRDICKKRREIVGNPTTLVEPTDIYMQYPIEVEVGGATVFVIDVDQFIKI